MAKRSTDTGVDAFVVPGAAGGVRDGTVASGSSDARDASHGAGDGERMLTVVVPGEPIAWERPVRLVTGRTITPGRVVQAERDIGILAKVAAQEQGFDLPIKGPVRMVLFFAVAAGWDAPRGIKDWDNMSKTVCDALNKIAYDDDRQVVSVAVTVLRGADDPLTVIRLGEYR